MFKITRGTGFHVEFKDCVLSTQFSNMSYCERRNIDDFDVEIYPKKSIESKSAEIVIWKRSDPDVWLTEEMNEEVFGESLSDSVKGWVHVDEWVKVVAWCAAYREGSK